jgi:S-formylglutathione hydrolase FrmB
VTRPARVQLLLLLGCLFWQSPFSIRTLPAQTRESPLRFEVGAAPGLLSAPTRGRLFVVISRSDNPEPRLTIGTTGIDAPLVLAADVPKLVTGVTGFLDRSSELFPLERLSDLPPGEYFVQGLFDDNIDLKSVNAPGNLYGKVQKLRLDPFRTGSVPIVLTERVPPERIPDESVFVKYVRLESKLLTAFHGRPVYLRAGIILPRDFDRDTLSRYPLEVNIGGYGDSYTLAGRIMEEGSAFRSMWLSDSTPRMIFLQLDGDGPFGDPYQVNSANNGPYGDALVHELIPAVEKKYRAIARPAGRFLTGGSTGGWVSLALQVFYPDSFNGTWSGYPDPVDFRAYQLVNIYEDTNAYVNKAGFERPAARSRQGDVLWTMRHELRMENMMGAGGSYVRSGGQWGAWNAAYGPRSKGGNPVPLWDPKTGRIDTTLRDYWKKYDLQLVLRDHWQALAPKLRGKLHIWVGESDDFFLNNAVHLLDEFLSTADPPYGGWIRYGPGEGHGWSPLSHSAIMKQMVERMR